MGAARDPSGDLDVELSWPEDELLARVPPGRGASSQSRPGGRREAVLARRAPELPSGYQRDVAGALVVLAKRIDELTTTVQALHRGTGDRLAEHGRQLGTLRRRVADLDSIGKAMSVLRGVSEELTKVIIDRAEQQDQLGQQVAQLTEQVKALRRRVPVSTKEKSGALTEGQAEAVAKAVVAALRRQPGARGNSSSGKAQRAPGRSNRK